MNYSTRWQGWQDSNLRMRTSKDRVLDHLTTSLYRALSYRRFRLAIELAEGIRFERMEGYPSATFKVACLDHSHNPPQKLLSSTTQSSLLKMNIGANGETRTPTPYDTRT